MGKKNPLKLKKTYFFINLYGFIKKVLINCFFHDDTQGKEYRMVSNLCSLNAYSYSSSVHAGGKVRVPVNPQYVIYSQLEHVAGVAADKNQSGINITKVQILNALLSNMSKTNQQPQAGSQQLNDAQVDSLLKQVSEQIQKSIMASNSTIFAVKTVVPQAGAVVNIAV